MSMRCAAALAALSAIVSSAPAGAVVKGRSDPSLAAHAVMILKSNGGFCSGVVLSPTTVLTAGHCVTGASAYRVHYKSTTGEPVMLEPRTISVHPGFVAGAAKARKKSVDLALVRLSTPLPPAFSPADLAEAGVPRTGETLVVGGYGLGVDGEAASGGAFRTASLGVIEPYGPSTLLVWLTDPATGKARNGAGACNGDSGGPVFTPDGSVIAITAFAEGAGATQCGALTQAVLLAPQRSWIERVTAGWK